jgi:predicted AAA+ superfamily ATPase
MLSAEPELFPALRVKIDEDRKKHGRFLISGSSSPQLLKNISESLAGRVAILEVPTLT